MNKNYTIKNTILSGRFKRLLFIVFISLLSGTGLGGQSFVKKMASGLNLPVNCSCSDTLGNVYAVTYKASNTTTLVYKWDALTRAWNTLDTLSKFNTKDISTCNVYNGFLYITGRNTITGLVELRQYNGTWINKGTFKYKNFSLRMNSIKFKNSLYFVGGFDSVGFIKTTNVVAYNGSSFSSTSFNPALVPGGLFESSLAIIGDSLYLSAREKILVHRSPSTWGVTFSNPSTDWFTSIANKDNLLYALTGGGSGILVLDKNVWKDSFGISGVQINDIESVKNTLFISGNNGSASSIYFVKNKKDVKFVLMNQLGDTSARSLLGYSNKLYYHGNAGVKVRGTDYRHIVEIDVDSLNLLGFDTIKGFVFWDKNNNYKKDGNDVFPNYGYVYNVSNGYYVYLATSLGTFNDVILDNQDVEYSLGSATFDSCIQAGYSGNIRSYNTKPGVARDSLYFPLVMVSKAPKNLILRNQSLSRARLLDTIPLTVNVKNRDCNYTNTTNGSVKVTLDTNTVFVSSVPAYTSKVGNVYTFSNLTFNYYSDNLIKLKVIYPNAKYTIGKLVRHYARLGNITGEDSLDNLDSIVQKMVYSYDPNAKHSVPEGKTTNDMKNIRYYIDFQNLGNDDAVRVTVVDTLNLKMPVYEFQMVANSHPYLVSITPGTSVVTWVFDNINLKPKSMNEPASKGYIIFDAKVKGNLKVGDSIRNRAYIYFDYNSPVITNFTVINKVDPKAGMENFEKSIHNKFLKAYPNPAGDYIKIQNALPTIQDLTIYDIKGAKVSSLQLDGNGTKTVITENWAKGLYIIVNEQGESLKIIIE